MSGGSFNYLCYAEPSDIIGRAESLAEMRDELLQRFDGADAAAEIEDLLATIRQFQVLVGVRLKRLHGVMRAVEWCVSGDTGPAHVVEMLTKYREGMR